MDLWTYLGVAEFRLPRKRSITLEQRPEPEVSRASGCLSMTFRSRMSSETAATLSMDHAQLFGYHGWAHTCFVTIRSSLGLS